MASHFFAFTRDVVGEHLFFVQLGSTSVLSEKTFFFFFFFTLIACRMKKCK